MQHEPATNRTEYPRRSLVSLTAAEWGLTAGALPAIAVGTDSPIGLAHWVLTAHYLAIAYGCHLLRTLRLFSDPRLQRRNGFLLLIVGSLACAAAPDAYTLVAARLPQAFGLACLLAAHSVGAAGSRLPVLPLVLGLLGGYVIGNLVGWRAVFVVIAMTGSVVGIRDWRQEAFGYCLLQEQAPLRAGRHPMILAGGLTFIIVPFNHYCDFRTFGLAEAVVLAVGIVMFGMYSHEVIRNLVASRSSLFNSWIGAIVAGLCLLPAIFHIQHLPSPTPVFAVIQTGCVLALAPVACGLILRLMRNAPPRINRLAPVAGFLLLAGILASARFWTAMESTPVFATTAAAAGAALGLAWIGGALRPVPMFSGLAAGVYVASYFLEFIPASFTEFSSPAAHEFLRQESSVLLVAAGVAFCGAGWGIARVAESLISRREKSGAGSGT
ncbi:MAG: hypothetical protein NT105_05905 [Verrucomicrobia bacterium]|nr:hypothetical protein [Verrucomicrobiota bacterium]